MPPKKPKPTGRRDNKKGNAIDDGVIDASPGGDRGAASGFEAGGPGGKSHNRSGKPGNQPRTIMETRPVQEGMRGFKAMWATYVAILQNSFTNMDRAKQEFFIVRFSQAVTIGSASLLILFFYAFLPTFVRVFLLPAVVVGAWWIGTRVVAPQMVARFSKYLN